MALMPESGVVLGGTGVIDRRAIVAAVVRVPEMHHACVSAVVSRYAQRHRRDKRYRHHLEDDEQCRQTCDDPAVHEARC